MRADRLLLARGLAASRTAAQRLIADGRVSGDVGRGWVPIGKPALDLPADIPLRVEADAADRYVSRGGLKLAGALRHTGLAVDGLVCLDIGQSTGGFTDCLLQAGAHRVIGVEVGHGQLHPRLAVDPRVTCLEGINARALNVATLGGHFPAGGFDLLVADASFISLTLILPALPPLVAPAGQILALVKPQFEVGPGGLGKGGIVRDPARHAAVEAKIRAACDACGLRVKDYFPSALRGGDGNREWFVLAG